MLIDVRGDWIDMDSTSPPTDVVAASLLGERAMMRNRQGAPYRRGQFAA